MLSFLLLAACAPEVESEPGGRVWKETGCGRWSGIQKDRAWDYAWVDNTEWSGTWTTEVGQFDGSTGRLTMQGNFVNAKFSRDYTDTLFFECDGGMWLTGVESQYAGADASGTFSGSSVTLYPEPVLVWPADVARGDAWDVHYLGTIRVDDGEPAAVDRTVHHQLESPAQVTVAAGDFRAFGVLQTTGEGDAAVAETVWVQPEIGLVSGPDYELTALR
ncbi:MAG: hypothetical protein EXR71_12880 [Myxococcales bacterium]|nr:hypothetical protein [Myxococcales bacterium]